MNPLQPNQPREKPDKTRLWRIAKRWQEWLPSVTLWAKRTAKDPEWTIKWSEGTHSAMCESLLNFNVSWPAIVSNRYDDPTIEPEDWPKVLQRAIRKREKHMPYKERRNVTHQIGNGR